MAPTDSFVLACRNNRIYSVITTFVLITHALLAFFTAQYCSVTHDEYWHIPVGLLNLQQQKFDYDDLNPPLGRMIAAFPLLFLADTPANNAQQNQPAVPEGRHTLTDYGDNFLEQQGTRYHSLIVAARIPTVLLSVAFAFAAATFATELFGPRSGLAALILWSFSPAMISFAALASNDSLVSGLFLLTFWRAWKLGQRYQRREIAWIGVCIGTACLVKFTGVLLFALAPAAVFISGKAGQNASPVRRTVIAMLSFSAIAVVVINAGYLFQGCGKSLNAYNFKSSSLLNLQQTLKAVGSLPVPFPAAFMTGVDHQKAMMESAHPVYLSGEWNESGFRSYYFWVLAWKIPHVLQLLFALTIWIWFRGRKLRATNAKSVAGTFLSEKFGMLLLPAIVLIGIGTFSGMQLGLRYVLPAMPLLIVFVSQCVSSPWLNRSRLLTILAWTLVAGSTASPRFHPHHIAYFNELAGGPDNAVHLLSDSNIDWGQDLRALKLYLDDHPEIDNLKLAYFGTFPPGKLDIKYTLPPPKPEPGWYALSVNIIQGRPNPLRRQDGSTDSTSIDPFTYIRFFTPLATIGKSIRVYKIEQQDIDKFSSAVRRARAGLTAE